MGESACNLNTGIVCDGQWSVNCQYSCLLQLIESNQLYNCFAFFEALGTLLAEVTVLVSLQNMCQKLVLSVSSDAN